MIPQQKVVCTYQAMNCEFWERPIGEAGICSGDIPAAEQKCPCISFGEEMRTRLDRLFDESSSVEMSESHTESVEIKRLERQPWRGV